MEKGLRTSPRIGTRQITVIGMLSAISIVLGVTGLGFIPIPPVKATIMHVPVIIGAMLEGPVVGAAVGLIFGIFSVVQSITTPTPVSFVFMNPLVSILPRILIGITTYYTYKMMKTNVKTINMVVAAAVGSLTNTIGVLGMIFLLYLEPYAKVLHLSVSAAKKGILAVGITNGIPETILSAVITAAVVASINKIRRK
ncbi:ECF transporter S component [Clostridium magnum]|uniref:Pantothenic acid transporter PanT n=1 Tax=Clostridium magnum DSM 2767 TaxID=1121326 RepID=A0A162T1E7_9CLOT|nr:ECF transporter S component [Clostridium magnum]KZL92127.1 pantothenic acid transporter PanT [Clostridium magnum DSM 2767]SHH21314.1 Uncharacterized membrane protein [Clostridium magnum DSM 2767]